jgi:hypothetical protein
VITDLTVNDLPQPGPPVSTATFAVRARRTDNIMQQTTAFRRQGDRADVGGLMAEAGPGPTSKLNRPRRSWRL